LVTAPHGIIGCLSKGKFIEEQQYINKGNYQAAQQQLDDEVCFYFEKGSKMFANEGTCSKNFKNDYLTNFKPNGFALLQVYLPCYSVR
ncbi:MAG: hypothetical protein SFV53_03150, partial [Rickettsiales bacterium]|nr:hypothetical protein [Rickettsiales bacterium]